MRNDPLSQAIYLTGPTAVGKTAVGVALARRIDAEIIAMDSMTLYRGMDIGAAKPTMAERAGVPHHLLDVLDPWESASVARYRNWAIEIANSIAARGRAVLFVGGTPMYLKALLRGLFEAPPIPPETRRRLEQEADAIGAEALHQRLAAVDPSTAQRVHPNDRRRIIRALEVLESTGRPISSLQTEHAEASTGRRVFALSRPRPVLHSRINQRVARMFAAGFLDEVRRLIAGPHSLNRVPAQAVGYREAIDHLAGKQNLEATIELVQSHSRQLAKRQATWFRGLAECVPWDLEDDEPPDQTAHRLVEAIDPRHGFAPSGPQSRTLRTTNPTAEESAG